MLLKNLFFFLFLFCVFCFPNVSFTQERYSHVDIQAVYVYKLTKFIRWPSEAKKSITVCSIGDNGKPRTIARSLEAYLKEKKNSTISIKKDITVKQIRYCNLLIVADYGPLQEAISATHKKTYSNT